MPKRTFGDMLETIDKPLSSGPTPQPSKKTSTDRVAKNSATPAAPETPAPSKPAKKPAPRTPSPAAAAGGVGYEKLERKDTRLHEHQISELTTLTRHLNRQRKGEGHRLTENTLIRLGVDLLLARADDLQGATEHELRASLGLS